MLMAVALAGFLASGIALVSLRNRMPRSGPEGVLGPSGVVGPGSIAVGEASGEGGGRNPDPAKPDPAVAALALPEFTLTTQDGGRLELNDLRGRVTIVDFMFTNCPFVCPVLTEHLRGVSNLLVGTPVRFLSITVDPEHDTPEALSAYAQLHEADTARWTFGTTGDAGIVRSILTDHLKFAIEDDPKNPITLPGGKVMNNIVHPSWFLLVGPDARPLGIYRSSDEGQRKALAERARVVAGAIQRR